MPGDPERESEKEPDESGEEEQLDNDAVDSVSTFEQEDEESSSSSESSDADAEDFPQPQPRKRRRVERYSPRITRPQTTRSRTTWRTTLAWQATGRDNEETEEREETDDEEDEAERAAAIAKEEEKARKLQWMEEAMKLGAQRANWLILTRTAGELKQLADPSLAELFADIWTTIRLLSRHYAVMADHRPSNAVLVQCDNLFRNIQCEGERLLDQAYHLATRRDRTRDDQVYAGEQVDEFEARVIPEMLKLVFACFNVYYTDAEMFPEAHGHFRRVLVLLRQFCDRTTSMKMRQIVHGSVQCKAFGRALSAIIKALDTRALQRRKPKASPTRDRPRVDASRGSTVVEDNTVQEWSQDEGLALIDGLRTYQGKLLLCYGSKYRY